MPATLIRSGRRRQAASIPGCRGLDEAAGRGLGRLARLQVLLKLDQLLHAVLHLRHGLDLRQPHASLVGDVVHPALTLRMLAVDTCTRQSHHKVNGGHVTVIPHSQWRSRDTVTPLSRGHVTQSHHTVNGGHVTQSHHTVKGHVTQSHHTSVTMLD